MQGTLRLNLGQDKHIEVQKHLLGTNPILIGELPSGWPKVHVDPYRGLKENENASRLLQWSHTNLVR